MVSRKGKNTSSARQKSPPVKLQLIRQFDETFDGTPEGELAKGQTVRLKEGPTNDEQEGEEREEDKEDGHVDEGNEDDEEVSEDDEDEGDPDDETTDPGDKGGNKNDKTERGDDGEDKDRAEQEVAKKLRERQPATKVKTSASKLDKVKETSVVKRPIAKIMAATSAEPAVLKPRVATTANIVFAAIASSTDKKGVSMIGIKKHFMNHYPEKDWSKSRVRVKTAISLALEEGSIVRTKPNGKAQGAQGMFKVKVKTLQELPDSVKVVKKNLSTSKASSKTAVKKSSKAKSPKDKENVKLSRKKPSKKNKDSEVEPSGKKMPAKRGAPVGRKTKGSPDPSSE